jgi:hypothetical protein
VREQWCLRVRPQFECKLRKRMCYVCAQCRDVACVCLCAGAAAAAAAGGLSESWRSATESRPLFLFPLR